MPFNEIFSAITSSLIISPIMTIIDTSIIKSQINKLDFKKSLLENVNSYLNRQINFTKPFNIMLFVYTSTYSTANLVELYCKKNDVDYKIPTLLTTTIVNIITIGYKDKEYSKIFNSKKSLFTKTSYGLFAIRDILTISSSFVFKNDVKEYLHNYMPNNAADLIASMTLPIMAQTISTPLHILAIDIYQRPNINLGDRIKNIKSSYLSVCSGRVIRVIPAFCIGGFINDMLRNKL